MGVPNIELADVSNATLVLAIVLYAIAMLAYACDFAFGKREPAEAAPARRPADLMETAALVGAGSGAKSGAGPQGLEFAGHAFPADPGDPSELADLSQEGTRRSGGAGVRLTEGSYGGRCRRRWRERQRAICRCRRPAGRARIRRPARARRHRPAVAVAAGLLAARRVPADLRRPGPAHGLRRHQGPVRAPRALGQHVRVHRGHHLRRRARAGPGRRPVPRVLPRPVRAAAGRARAGRRRGVDLHPGRPARSRAPVVLDRHPRDRDDHRDRDVHLRRRRDGAVPAVGPARPPGGRRSGVGVGGHHGAGCLAPMRSTGWPTARSCSRSPPGRSR